MRLGSIAMPLVRSIARFGIPDKTVDVSRLVAMTKAELTNNVSPRSNLVLTNPTTFFDILRNGQRDVRNELPGL